MNRLEGTFFTSWALAGALCAVLLGPIPARAAASASCADMASLSINDVKITGAVAVKAPYTAEWLGYSGTNSALVVDQDFCRVQGIATPEGSSGIAFEVWLPPSQAWKGYLRAEGNGGSSGSLQPEEMDNALKRGFATVSNNQGHDGYDWGFAKNPWSVNDFFGRAQHVTTVAAKQIVTGYYGRPAEKSFYQGCSRGGDRGLQAAQVYPDDYDGIVADDSGVSYVGQMATEAWNRQWTGDIDPGMGLPKQKLELIHKAVLAQCGKSYGNLPGDDFLNNPSACDFKPSTLLCKRDQDQSQCLTTLQVQALEKVDQGAHDPVTRRQIAKGFSPGGELDLAVGPDRQPPSTPGFFFGDYLLGEKVDFKTFNLHTAMEAASRQIVGGGQKLMDIATLANPTFEAFRAHGGKIIITSAWHDCCRSPFAPIDYYGAITVDQAKRHQLGTEAAAAETRKFARLFMIPGVSHCGGGEGPTEVGRTARAGTPPEDADHDVFSAVVKWVATGVAPDKVIATKYRNNNRADGVVFTRPICPYPQIAIWDGKGSQSVAASFMCHTPK